jgi:predicted nucleic acid-binding protein
MADRVVFLDACVLYPPLVRGLLLRLADAGLFTPRWSPRVLAEWRIATARKRGMAAEEQADVAVAAMTAQFPEASVEPAPDSELEHRLPDPADAHVLAAAIASGAEILLTFNTRDFPVRALAAHGITPRHPDGFLWELFSHWPEAVEDAISGAAGDTGLDEAENIRRALKRAHLPRFAKGWWTRLQTED